MEKYTTPRAPKPTDKQKQCYIAGPMRGYPRWNFDAFDAEEAKWKAEGWKVLSPATVDRALGFDPDGPDSQVTDAFLKRAILRDIEFVMDSDAIVLLPGWQDSSGVAVELAAARMMRIPAYDVEKGCWIE